VLFGFGCGDSTGDSGDPTTRIWISFQTNLSSVSVDIDVTGLYNTQSFSMPPGGNSQTNQIVGEVGDLVTFKVIGPGGTTTVSCNAGPQIVGGSANPPHSVFGELNVEASNASTLVACGNNWQ
jgi:hypothetical protein